MPALTRRAAFALAACVLGTLPVACGPGASSLPGVADSGVTKTISSGGPANPGGGGGGGGNPVPVPVAPPGGGGGGGGKAPLPGALAFTSGCGAIDSVSNTVAVTPGLPLVTITTKVAEHNCVDIFFSVDWVNTTTGQVEAGQVCFNFTKTPYTCSLKDKTALPDTTYEVRIKVWNAALAGDSLATPIDPAWILGTESLTVSTVGAPPAQGI